jgi:DNA polymerase
MATVHLDFETRSMCDLKLAGARAYAEHPTTEIICLCYHVGDQEYTWLPGEADIVLDALADEPDTIFTAHSAQFEQAIWHCIMVEQYGFPPIPIERWDCTQAAAAHRGIPLALDKGAKALGVPIEKDAAGNKLTLSFSKINPKTGMLLRGDPTPEELQRIIDYCHQDVRVEKAVELACPSLLTSRKASERPIWLMDQRINNRGVRLDLEFVQAAQRVVARATGPLLQEFKDLTGGLAPGQVAKVVEWCGGQGVELDNLQKGTIAALLDTEEDEDDGYTSLAGSGEDDLPGAAASLQLPPTVRRVLTIRQMLGSASVKKLQRMLACVGDDGRARGLLQYHAASPGRWGGRLLQPQNFPRGDDGLRKRASVDECVEAIMSGDPEFVEAVLELPAIEAVASSLRYALIPDPGKVFLVGDYAGIEMRIVLAMAGQLDKCDLLATGKDVYLDMANSIYGRSDLTKDNVKERTIGKNTVLGCGFGMGWRKFSERYCPEQTEEFAQQVVSAYRKQWAPLVPELWYGLDAAALRTVKTGIPAESHGVLYRRDGHWLTAQLPSGWQKIWYPEPRMGYDEAFNRECWSYRKQKSGKMLNAKAYGGS